jgi:hypothetical protein
LKRSKIHIYAELPDQELIDSGFLPEQTSYFFVFIRQIAQHLDANVTYFKERVSYDVSGFFVLEDHFGRRKDIKKNKKAQQRKMAIVATADGDAKILVGYTPVPIVGGLRFRSDVSMLYGKVEIANKMKGSYSQTFSKKTTILSHKGEYKDYAEFFAAYVKIYSEENPGLLTREMDNSSYIYSIPGFAATDIIRLFKNKNDAHVFLQKKLNTALTFLAEHTAMGTVVVINDKPRELENKAGNSIAFIEEVMKYIESQENIELIQIGLYSSDQQELLSEVIMHFDLHKLTEETINQLGYEWRIYNDYEKWDPIKAEFANALMAKSVDL